MAVHKLFDLENEIGTRTTYRKGTNTVHDASIGICKALSAVWCRNVLDGKGKLASRPSYQRASLIQAKGEMWHGSKGADLTNVLQPLDMQVTSIICMHGKKALHHVAITPGLYMLRYPGHAMAAQNTGEGWFFLDPEEGLFLCTSARSFEKQVWQLYGDEQASMWTCQTVVDA